MKQEFTLSASPVIARRLQRLLSVIPSTKIDPAILELAEQGLLVDEVFVDYPDAPRALVQEIVDTDFRAVIGMPEPGWEKDHDNWLYPILVAAKIAGITDVVFDNTMNRMDCATLVNKLKLNGHWWKCSDYLPENNEIPRSALCIMVGGDECVHLSAAMEFFRTIIVTDEKHAKRISIFPNMPVLSSVYSMKPDDLSSRGFANLQINRMAFLFNVILRRQRENDLERGSVS